MDSFKQKVKTTSLFAYFEYFGFQLFAIFMYKDPKMETKLRSSYYIFVFKR